MAKPTRSYDTIAKRYYGHEYYVGAHARTHVVNTDEIAGKEISLAHIKLETWTELHRQALKLRDLERRHSKDIKPDDDLPADYLYALLL